MSKKDKTQSLVINNAVVIMKDEEVCLAKQNIEIANQLQDFISDCDAKSRRYAEASMLATIKLGRMLSSIKSNMIHGEWGKLFKSNSNHGWNFNFSQETARKYMACYEKSMAMLDKEEQLLLSSLTPESSNLTDDIGKLIYKATNGAETVRQMYLNFDLTGRGSNLDEVRNIKGRPKKDKDALPEDVEKALELERQDSISKAAQITEDLIDLVRLNMHTLLPEGTRRAFVETLRGTIEAVNQVKD